MPTPQSCVEALRIESGLSLLYAFRYKKPGFLPRTPLPPPEWAVQLFMWDGTVCWNLLCLFRGTAGRSSPGFLYQGVAGQGQILLIDCLPKLNRPLPILPKNWDYNQCTIVIFEMFSGHRSTLGNGLSGQPRLWKVVADFPMFVSCVCVANEQWSLGTVPWAESDSLQKQFMGKPRRRWCAP